MSKTDRILDNIINLKLFGNSFVALLIDFIVDNFNILRSVFGIRSHFVGQTRLAFRIFNLLSKDKKSIKVKPSGIYSNDTLIEDPHYHILEFMPLEGLTIEANDISKIKEIINDTALKKDKSISIEYYRVRGLFKLVMLGFLLSFLYLAYLLLQPFSIQPLSKKLLSLLCAVPNIYFFFQTILFYESRLKHLSGKTSFEESSEEEEECLKKSLVQPYVVAVVPTYMEEASLLMRTLYSHCLQSYKNMHVVLLLGNEVYTSDEKVIDNTRQMKRMAINMKKELFSRKRKNAITLKGLKSIDFEGMRLVAGSNNIDLKDDLELLQKMYRETAEWFINKAGEIKKSEVKYPIDNYLIKHSFISRYKHFRRQSTKCRKLSAALQCDKQQGKQHGSLELSAVDAGNKIMEYYLELRGLFNITLEVFMRTKFENLEQEKTKAGNLTAYSSIIGGTWCRKRQANGKFELISSRVGKHIREPKYFASFDSDTVTKPNYIVRKVAFLEREVNSKVGLIQSPYVVPTPEPTNVASASGIHSYWFLPVSVALSFFKSAFWLGYNGVLRFEAVKKIKSFITDTIIEDTQNSIKLKREGYQIITSSEEQCMTYSPADLKALKVQRIRWASGGLKIAKDLISGILKKERVFNSFSEIVLGLNYVLGLTMLPLAITSLFFIESPFFYHLYFFETIPYFLYILSYISLLRYFTKYRFKNIIDGLAMTQFLNFYHLVGVYNSVKILFKNKEKLYYKTTPRTRAFGGNRLTSRFALRHCSLCNLGDLEFFSVTFLVLWLGLRFMNDFTLHEYNDIFPIYQIVITLYGVYRFGDRSKALAKYPVKESKKNSGVLEIKGKRFGKDSFIKVLRTISLITAIVLLGIIPLGNLVYGHIEMNRIREAAELELLEDRSGLPRLDAFVQCKKLGRGINLGNCLEAPKEGQWGLKLSEEYFKIISDAGFETIRLPVRWSAHAQKWKPYRIDESFFARVDWVLMMARKYSLNVVLDFHGYNEIYFHPDSHTNRFLSIWGQIAKRYKDCDSSLYYEILNEPCEKLTPEKWFELMAETISGIRKYDNYHTIIVTGAYWGGSKEVKSIKIPDGENNVICTFHTYTPMPFTHQGTAYSEKEFYWLKGIVWPGPPEKPLSVDKRIKSAKWLVDWINLYNTLPYESNPSGPKEILEELDEAYSWGKKLNRPVWLGEFGVIRNADLQSRIRWTRFVVEEAEKRDIPWACWDFAGNCGFYDLKKKKWEEGFVEAILNRKWPN